MNNVAWKFQGGVVLCHISRVQCKRSPGNSREGLCYAIFPGYNVRDNLEIPGNGLCFLSYFQGIM